MHFYRDILKRAWQVTYRNPFLWFFGVFAALAGNGEQYDSFFDNVSFVGNLQFNMDQLREAHMDGKLNEFWSNFTVSFGDNVGSMLLLLFVALVILFLFFWLVTISQAALIRSAQNSSENKPIAFLDIFGAAIHRFWPLFRLNLIVVLFIYGPLVLLGLPALIIYLDSGSLVWSVGLSLLAFLFLIPIGIVLAFLTKFASAYIVLEGQSALQGIRSALQLFRKNWLVAVETGLLLLIINFIYAFVAVSIMTMLGFPLTQAGVVAFTVVMIILGSIYAVFRYTTWTMLWRELVNDKGTAKLVRLFQNKEQ
ncbi:MAG: hypothetical protein H6760_04500 [Candidatus Nomurabacteria bacterium]|nr:MAG: hypothetical protein H6760_04500 [Candidatus Nomurabacteria bacterium]